MQHGSLVVIKQKQTVLRYYSLVNCIHTKKLTVLLKHINPNINVATTEIPTMVKLFDRSCSQTVISIWQDVWSNGKIAVHRSRKYWQLLEKKHIMMDVLLE